MSEKYNHLISYREINGTLMPFDIRHRSIIDSLPVYGEINSILDVGCGRASLAYKLSEMDYKVTGIDMEKHNTWDENKQIHFIEDDFLNTDKLAEAYDVIICSEVLEHLPNYKSFFNKILQLAKLRVIITVPYQKSFNVIGKPPTGHCNFWSFSQGDQYRSIGEFITMSKPYSTSISKIRTKERDIQMNQWCFLIVIDKRQNYG